ncbi:hypothetical protein, partial [Nocardia sp. NPDC049149]|uniref:hypothetical protein n=1 Tax=Nocardia sp. NPDC049149 TaxID=3364315 RepID=UPI0037161456
LLKDHAMATLTSEIRPHRPSDSCYTTLLDATRQNLDVLHDRPLGFGRCLSQARTRSTSSAFVLSQLIACASWSLVGL